MNCVTSPRAQNHTIFYHMERYSQGVERPKGVSDRGICEQRIYRDVWHDSKPWGGEIWQNCDILWEQHQMPEELWDMEGFKVLYNRTAYVYMYVLNNTACGCGCMCWLKCNTTQFESKPDRGHIDIIHDNCNILKSPWLRYLCTWLIY